MTYVIKGMGELRAALAARGKLADVATGRATADAAHLVERTMKAKLTEATHPAGTPTTSSPGSPPALVTGQLRRGVRIDGPVRVGPAVWKASIGPTSVYSRIQELGGTAGRGGISHLPRRPFVAPTLVELTASGQLRDVYMAAWRTALGG